MKFLFHIFVFLFSILSFTYAHAGYSYAQAKIHWYDQGNKKNFKESNHHHDYAYSYGDIWNNRSALFCHQPHFNKYMLQDFSDYFTSRGYTQEEILNQRCLYMFDEFVKFAQTYSSYEDAIRQIL